MAQNTSNSKSSSSKNNKNMSNPQKNVRAGSEKAKIKNGKSTNKSQAQSVPAKPAKKTTDTPLYLKFVYAFMLLLLLAGGVARVAGKNTSSQSAPKTPLAQAPSQSLSAKALTFHREGGPGGVCDDLVVTVNGDAVLAACSSGSERQYQLSTAEKQQLVSWLGEFKSFDFDSGKPGDSSGLLEKLSMNGHGTRVASEADVQKVLGFVSTLDSEISAQQ